MQRKCGVIGVYHEAPNNSMWFSAVILGVYLVATEILDWAGRMEVIENRLPGVAKLATTREFRLLLLLVVIGLLIATWREAPHSSEPGTNGAKTGDAIATGSGVIANTGNSATIENGTAERKTHRNNP